MPAKKPKLPKVWVVLDDVGYPHDRRPFMTRSNSAWPLGWVERQYAPVQKPRVCVWKLRPNSVTNGETACGWWMDRDSTHKFCACCGGKIKRVKR